jgi:hypothetical protein
MHVWSGQYRASIPIWPKLASSVLIQNWLAPFQAIPVRWKPTFAISSHSSQAKTSFWHSKSLQSGQNQLPPFQAITIRSKPTTSLLGHSSKVKTDFCHSQPFQLSQNRLPSFQAITVKPKPTFSIPNHSSLSKSSFLHSTQAKMCFLPTSHSSMANIVDKSSLLSSPSRSWSPDCSVLVTRCDFVAYGQGMQKTLQDFLPSACQQSWCPRPWNYYFPTPPTHPTPFLLIFSFKWLPVSHKMTNNTWHYLLSTFWQLFDNFLTTFLTIFWQLFTTFWQLFDNFLTIFWQLFDNFFDNFLTIFFFSFWHNVTL